MSAVLKHQVNDALPQENRSPIIVIGTGPVGIRVAQEILRREPQRPLVMFGDEPWLPYNRVQLSSLLAGDVSWDELQNPLHVETSNRVLQHHNCAVVSIDRDNRNVLDREGRRHPYSSLILAVGSRPHMPSIPGISQAGVFRFRDMSDMQALAARNIRSRKVVVLGGGLLGLEAARGLSRGGTEVTVVEHAPRLMPNQLDQAASDLLEQHLAELGIRLILGDALQKVVGDGKVTALQLRESGTLACDTLVLATGIRPNLDLARGCGIRVGRGIVVDDHCLTSDPHVYAIGECVEHRGEVYGLVAPGLEQAAVVAHQLTGQDAQFTGSMTAAHLKVIKHSVFSLGCVNEEHYPQGARAWVYQDAEQSLYRKLITQRGRLIGVIGLGAWTDLRRLQEALLKGRTLLPWQLKRFEMTGCLWSEEQELGIHDWPDDAVVCNCTGVSRGVLSAALAAGCTSVEQLKTATGASSVCGSCQPLLAEMVGSTPVPADRSGIAAVLIASVLALVLLALLMLPADWLVADSVQSPLFSLSNLWRDGFWKQVTGFSMLGLMVIGLGLSLRKRAATVTYGRFGYWRAVHAVLGTLTLVVLLLHTGLQFGERLNAWLLSNYLLLGLAGAVAGAGSIYAAAAVNRSARQIQRWTSLAHLYISWPFPLLIAFHVLSVYYF